MWKGVEACLDEKELGVRPDFGLERWRPMRDEWWRRTERAGDDRLLPLTGYSPDDDNLKELKKQHDDLQLVMRETICVGILTYTVYCQQQDVNNETIGDPDHQ
ncbi:hypothetical protein CEXT_203751 [Caerostris extrusa]|uniref:Uncharacterized protein n=1 Tax=Caerostris extrusa TaxID=172846 RepID=A0AAV4NYP3_CAEEX|nr:hypothetical protein CEXT_203751 [Caerostris extrusa]